MPPAKRSSAFICGNCGYQTVKPLGRCPICGEWNAFVEETPVAKGLPHPARSPVPILEVPSAESTRIPTGIHELDRVLGGGLVQGACILLAGEPGIGKSTLLLQMAESLTRRGQQVLYISGEESPSQVKIRAERLGALSPRLLVGFQTDVDAIENTTRESKPQVLIVDSIQTIASSEVEAAPGSILQVRTCAARLFALVKELAIPLILAGHVTKEGAIAGPKLLEHLVDAVVYFEGEKSMDIRVLRAQKNRFGDTGEIGLFRMTERGLLEMTGAEHLFLGEAGTLHSGILTATLDGARVLLVEVQALASPSYLSIPRRVTNGFDYNRLLMILAILDKHGVHFGQQDVYVNVLGGISLADPGADLAVAIALSASLRDWQIPPLVAIGELGLGGEVRSVPNLAKRLEVSSRLGFRRFLVPVFKDVSSDGKEVTKWPLEDIRSMLRVLREITKEALHESNG